MKRIKNKNIIIGGLLAIVLIIAVGYAAFATRLTINGTSNISSNWDVHIKDNGVTYNVVNDAENVSASKTNALTATFACDLKTPGVSSVDYFIDVENTGSFDAVLDTITITPSNNANVNVEVTNDSALKENVVINKNGDHKVLKLEVSLKNIASVPANTAISITVTLDFSQYTSNSGSGSGGLSSQEIEGPSTVYAYHTETKTTGVDVIINGEPDYVDLDSYKEGKTWFLKYDLDENHIIQTAYVCQKFTGIDEPVCLQQRGVNARDTLLEVSNNSMFINNGGSCDFSSWPYCTDGNRILKYRSDGSMVDFSNTMSGSCTVNYNTSSCN